MNPEEEELNNWKAEIKGLREKSKTIGEQPNLIAFYGSSSIRMWENMESDLEPYKVINLGFGGSSYRWCDHFFDEVFEFVKPKRIVLYGGDNDLGGNTPQNDIIAYVLSLINKINSKSKIG